MKLKDIGELQTKTCKTCGQCTSCCEDGLYCNHLGIGYLLEKELEIDVERLYKLCKDKKLNVLGNYCFDSPAFVMSLVEAIAKECPIKLKEVI